MAKVWNVLAAAASACALLGGCAMTPLPASDSAPPALTWQVRGTETGNTVTVWNKRPEYSARNDEALYVTLRADDAGGVQRIQLAGVGDITCAPLPNGNAIGGTVDIAAQTQTLSPNAQGFVLTSIFLTGWYNVTDTCVSDAPLQQYTVHLTGVAEDFHGNKTTEHLVLVWER